MIIRRIWPFANDHLEGPASCKWSSFTLVTIVTSSRIQIQSRGPFQNNLLLFFFGDKIPTFLFSKNPARQSGTAKLGPTKSLNHGNIFCRSTENMRMNRGFFCNFRISFNHAFQGNKGCEFFMEFKIDSFCMKLYNTCFEIVSPVSFAFDQA